MFNIRKDLHWLKRDLRQLMKPYYLINIFLSLSYIIAKRLPYVCHFLFSQNDCELDDVSYFFKITISSIIYKLKNINFFLEGS